MVSPGAASQKSQGGERSGRQAAGGVLNSLDLDVAVNFNCAHVASQRGAGRSGYANED